MVVCKFFQQGSCRFGQSCRYDHIYSSKYSYHAPSEPSPAAPAVTDDQLVNQVHTDLQSMLRGGQWLLSGYAPFKEKPAFPGLVDMSPEEARLFIYEARANNTLDQAVAFMNNIFQEAKQKYDTLLTKNANITKVLRSLYNGENVADPFSNLPNSNSAFGNNNASSVFRSAVQPSQPSMFAHNNTPSVFGQSNAFVQPVDAAKSIFAQASQNANQPLGIFGAPQNVPPQASIFGQPAQPMPQSAQSIFAQATQNVFAQQPPQPPAQNVFSTQNAQNTATSIFASASQNTPFSTPESSNAPTNIFQQPAISSGFIANQHKQLQQQAADTGVYSKVEDISQEDLEAFNSEEFKMGFIPEIPPPQSLCF